jgi:hypothetical protein
MGRSIVGGKFGGKYVGCPESKNTNAIKFLKKVYLQICVKKKPMIQTFSYLLI